LESTESTLGGRRLLKKNIGGSERKQNPAYKIVDIGPPAPSFRWQRGQAYTTIQTEMLNEGQLNMSLKTIIKASPNHNIPMSAAPIYKAAERP